MLIEKGINPSGGKLLGRLGQRKEKLWIETILTPLKNDLVSHPDCGKFLYQHTYFLEKILITMTWVKYKENKNKNKKFTDFIKKMYLLF